MTILLATLMPAYAVLLLLIVGALVFVRKRRSRKRAVKLMNRSKLMARNLLYSEAGTVVKHKRSTLACIGLEPRLPALAAFGN